MTHPLEPELVVFQPDQPDPQNNQRLEKAANWIALIVVAASIAMAASLISMALTRPAPSAMIPATGFVVTFIAALLSWVRRAYITQWKRVIIVTAPLYLSLILYTALIQSSGLPMAAGLLIATYFIASWSLEGQRSDIFITLGIVTAMGCSLVDIHPFFPRVDDPSLVVFGYINFALMTVAYLGLTFAGKLHAPLRTKISLAALLILLIPVSIIAVIDIRTMRDALQNQTNQALLNSAKMMASRVDEFIKTNRASIATQAGMPVYANYLALDLWERNGSQQDRELQIALQSLHASLKVKERTYLVSFALLDHLGNVVYSSVPGEIGQSEREAVYFTEPVHTGRAFDSNIEFSPEDNQPYIYFSQIIKNDEQRIVGVLRARFDAMILQSYAKEFTGVLSEDSYPILIDEHMVRLAEPISPVLQWKTIAPLSVAQEKQLTAANRLPAHVASTDVSVPNLELAEKVLNLDNEPFFAVTLEDDHVPDSIAAVKLSSRPWIVVFSQSQDIVMAAMKQQAERAIMINTLVAGIIAVISTLMARVLSNQIQSLTNTAEEISRGNLHAKARIVTEDELGTLGRAFNFMNEQILNLINGLEDRVQARTRELARQNETLRFRARQFETVADVARGVTSTRNLEELLNNVTRLISDRFEFYHVGIFLLDDARDYAVLRAANSEGGQRMLARKHQLLVGHTGMVGYAAASGEARIATDVGSDAVFFNNPDLPLTRSEMALPLKANDEIIGVLDVQSTVSNAFSQDDIQLFGILADQVAIAIYNNRLYSETAQALDEAQRVHQRYLHQAWQHELENYQHHSYRFNGETTSPYTGSDEPEIHDSLQAGVSVVNHNGASTLAIPVSVRGETIGVIRLREDNPRREWDDEEKRLVHTVADQMAVALENARLFTQTTRRAERERKVLEITSKIRSTNDPQAILKVAAEELRQALNVSRAQITLQPEAPNEPDNQPVSVDEIDRQTDAGDKDR